MSAPLPTGKPAGTKRAGGALRPRQPDNQTRAEQAVEMSRDQVVELIPALRAFARTFCPHPEDADDLVQETLTRAIANLDQFSEGTRLKSWLFTIMRNTFSTR